jgi:thiol-disulfide isomerase/thioredoxin
LIGAEGQPVPGARVAVEDGPVDTSIVATADQHGRFSMTLPEPGGYVMYLKGHYLKEERHRPVHLPLIVTDDEPVEFDGHLGKPTIRSGDPTVEGIVNIYREMEEMERRIGQVNRSYGPLLEEASTEEEREALRDSARQAVEQFADSLAVSIRQRIQSEDNPILRQWLMLRYFDELGPAADDSTLARRALREVPPTSPFWSYEAGSRVGASNLIAKLAWRANAPELATSYVDEVIRTHPDPDVRRHFLYRGIRRADNAGDEKRKMRYYGQMMSEFGGTYHAMNIKREFAPDKDIQAGKPIPEYSLASMSDSSVTYNNENMEGSVYLINTWATWCRPCIAKMDELHKVYKMYKDEGFDILSISLDRKRADVEEFRQEQWTMPWKHHFAGFSGEGRKTIQQTFEVVGIPHPILVDGNGEIIAAEENLRGEKLSQTLKRVFEEK